MIDCALRGAGVFDQVNYYNEFDPHAAAWLRQLIADGLIPPGDVDERSITDVQARDLEGYDQCHFFAGIGGWDLALQLAGWPSDRQVWTGSCPCQPFSTAGKRAGVDDERHLWPQFARLIAECRPAVVFGEQVASKAGRAWLSGVRVDLEAMGYGVGAADLCAAGIGAPHIRQRLYWLANANGRQPGEAGAEWIQPGREYGQQSQNGGAAGGLADAPGVRREQRRRAAGAAVQGQRAERSGQHPGSEQERQLPRGFEGLRRAGGLGHPQRARLEGYPGNESDGHKSGRQHPDQGRPVAAAGCDSWSDFAWIPCADGKARRIKPGLVPLVNGLPRGMVPSVDPGASGYAEKTGEARVMRLRGYGNAIVPPLAAAFVGAFMDTQNT